MCNEISEIPQRNKGSEKPSLDHQTLAISDSFHSTGDLEKLMDFITMNDLATLITTDLGAWSK